MSSVVGEVDAARVMERIGRLAACSEEPDRLTRTYLTPAHQAASELVASWMREAGLEARRDAVGNVVGRYESRVPGAPALMIGSHIDTVRDAGVFDGMLGVVGAIECVQGLADAGERLDHAVEVVAFADEEGVRFGATLLGSRGITGNFDDALLERRDGDGVAMAEALGAVGLDATCVANAARRPEEIAAFVELHIEQGPVLLDADLPVGVVTAIAGATRFEVRIVGQAGHAGTVPMGLRRDAAAAAAEVVLLVEERCSREPGLVGTVGRLAVPGGVTNVVPGAAELSIDLRSGEDALRERAVADVLEGIEAVARERAVAIAVERVHEAPAAPCAGWLVERLEGAVAAQGIEPLRLPSGAGHDAMAFHGFTDMAMLFVRCGNGGISHHPDETMTEDDARVGCAVLRDFVRAFEPRRGDG